MTWIRWALLALGASVSGVLAFLSWRRWGRSAMLSRERASLARMELDRGRDAALVEIRRRYRGAIDSLSEDEKERAMELEARPDELLRRLREVMRDR